MSHPIFNTACSQVLLSSLLSRMHRMIKSIHFMDKETIAHRGTRSGHRKQDIIPKVFQFIHGILTGNLSDITCCAGYQEYKTGKGN